MIVRWARVDCVLWLFVFWQSNLATFSEWLRLMWDFWDVFSGNVVVFHGGCVVFQASTSGSSPKPIPDLNNLDAALHELGMLSTLTDSRREYLKELNNKRPVLNLVEMNTRYVSSISIGLRKKAIHSYGHLRVKPYVIPRQREERHRTRSENSDVCETSTSLVASVIDAVVSVATDDVQSSIKKSKSLENVHLEQSEAPNPQPEVELVSTCIQKLKMAEWQTALAGNVPSSLLI